VLCLLYPAPGAGTMPLNISPISSSILRSMIYSPLPNLTRGILLARVRSIHSWREKSQLLGSQLGIKDFALEPNETWMLKAGNCHVDEYADDYNVYQACQGAVLLCESRG
jgi:hypothetical protein